MSTGAPLSCQLCLAGALQRKFFSVVGHVVLVNPETLDVGPKFVPCTEEGRLEVERIKRVVDKDEKLPGP